MEDALLARKSLAVLAALALVAVFPTAPAASASKDGKGLPASISLQRTDLLPPPIVADRIGGLKISVTQVHFPGVPDRASCRFVVRAVNSGQATLSTYALMRTLDGDKAELNTWMVPTGALAPGEASERLYSCKHAQYLVLDQQSLDGWPGRCMVNGEERSPCPLTLALEANLNIIGKR